MEELTWSKGGREGGNVGQSKGRGVQDLITEPVAKSSGNRTPPGADPRGAVGAPMLPKCRLIVGGETGYSIVLRWDGKI